MTHYVDNVMLFTSYDDHKIKVGLDTRQCISEVFVKLILKSKAAVSFPTQKVKPVTAKSLYFPWCFSYFKCFITEPVV